MRCILVSFFFFSIDYNPIESRQSLSPSLTLILKIFGNKGLEFAQDYIHIHIDIRRQFQVQCILVSFFFFSIESRQSLSLLLKIFGNKELEFVQDYIHIDIRRQFRVRCILVSFFRRGKDGGGRGDFIVRGLNRISFLPPTASPPSLFTRVIILVKRVFGSRLPAVGEHRESSNNPPWKESLSAEHLYRRSIVVR